MTKVGILIIDDDAASQIALQHVLDSEGWKVRIVPLASHALAELASGSWTLAIANVAMTGVEGPLFTTLKELALAPALEAGRARVRVLFLVPELANAEAHPVLERERLPYTLKPFHLNDFLEKVSDLLLETHAIPAPIRRVRRGDRAPTGRATRASRPGRDTSMFSSRQDYMMTEEEIAEFEKQEKEERKSKQKKMDDLGRP